jgi:2,3-bisphosphoglycerate-independent phosphoglycerate mutase
MLEMVAKKGLKNVAIHAILDGRDVAPSSAESALKNLQDKIDLVGVGHIDM